MPTLSRDQASCYVSAHSLIPLARTATGIILVATNNLVAQNLCCGKHTFVAKTVFCRHKHVFVVTKMMLVAALASNSLNCQRRRCGRHRKERILNNPSADISHFAVNRFIRTFTDTITA